MKKLLALILFYLISSHSIIAQERSEQEIKAGVFLEDLESIGSFKKIEQAPVELFDNKHKSFTSRSSFALTEVGRLFVQQKGLLEKYPARMMKGMVYFEFFYQQQLKDNERAINNFKAKYPPRDPGIIKPMQKLYSLNKARKSMREALGLSLNDDMSKVLSTQLTMYKLLDQSKTSINKLTREEKKIIKLDKNINKEVGKVKTLVEKRSENRITENKFLKEYSTANKKLINALKKAQYRKEYELLVSFVNELDVYKNKDISVIISGLKLTEIILKDLKKTTLKKKFDQDLSKANFDIFNEEELIILSKVTKETKFNKNIKSNEIQIHILNLENNKLPVSRLLDVFRNELGVELNSINLQLASKETMDKWVLSDWANAWKSPIPTKKQKNTAGIEISLTKNEIESVKAQLAMQNFKELIDIDQFKDLITNNSNLAELQASVIESTKSFNFTYTLDDWAVDFGNYNGFDLNNYADLTALANAQYGANWSVEEYSTAYQNEVDLVNALRSGNFDSSMIETLGASMNDVVDGIVTASTAGISVDLEAAAEGLGYDSFADAVAAYNEANGTSYTEAQAREALGQ